MTFPAVPVETILPALQQALATNPLAVITAPPGSGKTTRIPLALLEMALLDASLSEADWVGNRNIILLEPRRVAARAAASYMASLLGEKPGETVGYTIRQERVVSAKTRIEVVTEAVLTRRILQDPELRDTAVILFDEFHERTLDGDIGLALALETQAAFRPDLRIMVMSATLDKIPLPAPFADANFLNADGKSWPVAISWLGAPEKSGMRALTDSVCRAIRVAMREQEGGILVFLPGEAEIRAVVAALGDVPSGFAVMPLYGNLGSAAQDAVIRPLPNGQRKIALATSIAETSLTIADIRTVIDSGLARRNHFDVGRGMGGLYTSKVSLAQATQRTGRAGRVAPGHCYRLWSQAEERALMPQSPAEIMEADLSGFALTLAAWGVKNPTELPLPEMPPAGHFAAAIKLLQELEAIDSNGGLTAHGRELAQWPLHPRLAHMILTAKKLGLAGTACDLAAILQERDILRAGFAHRQVDISVRLAALQRQHAQLPDGMSLDSGALARARETARRLRQMAAATEPCKPEMAGILIALAWPERVAQRRGNGWRLRQGSGATLAAHDGLAGEDYLAIADLEGSGVDARVFLAARVELVEIQLLFADEIQREDSVSWDRQNGIVVARRQTRLGALILADTPLPQPPVDKIAAAICAGIRREAAAAERGTALPWSEATIQLRGRVAMMRNLAPQDWPDLSDEALLTQLETWCPPWLEGVRNREHLARVKWHDAVFSMLDWSQKSALERLAPVRITVPSGNEISLDYSANPPILAVKLQEMFGQIDTPTLADGKVRVMVHLLSPGRFPVAVTQDLASFWRHSYRDVRTDLRGRYPRHPWPDDPFSMAATHKTKRALERK